MKELVKDFQAIYQQDRGMLVVMGVVILSSLVLIVSALIGLDPATPKLRAAQYSDLRGYVEGDWWYLISFGVLGLLLGLVHSLLAAKIYVKRGSGAALAFLCATLVAILIVTIFLWRILGEN